MKNSFENRMASIAYIEWLLYKTDLIIKQYDTANKHRMRYRKIRALCLNMGNASAISTFHKIDDLKVMLDD